MNKFFKRLALLLAVLMIVSMMPVQLFADNSVAGEGQSNGTGESYLTISGIKGFEGRQFASFAEAYTAIKPVLEGLCAGDALGQGVADAEAFDALFTNRDEKGNATLTYTISGNVVYNETDYANLLTMGRRASHYGNDRHLINFKFVGATGKEADTLTVNSNITLPYEWWGEKTVTSISFENLTITGSAPSGLYPSQSFFEGINFKVNNCNLKGIKIYNCSNVKGTYTITNSTLDGTGAPADAYAIHLQGKETEPLTINISGNTISGYDRGINIDQNTANATISGNTISIKDAGRSCIQLSSLTSTVISNNTLELTGGNAITLHENLLTLTAAPNVTVEGNTITGNGYLIYDGAAAKSQAFTSEKLTLTIGKNTVASNVDTEQGVYGGEKFGLSKTVATVVKDALTPAYVATVNGVGYATLADAIAAANGNGTVTLLTATTELVQALLDGQYGSIDGLTIELPTGDYGKLELGRATKYAGSNTEYFVGGFDSTAPNYKAFTSADEIREYKGQSAWTPNCFYRRALNNVTIKAADGATVTIEKISADAGQIYGKADAPKYDYVLDVKILDTNKSYYMALAWNNVKFEGINFKSSVNIESSSEKTQIDGLHFEKCNFNSGYTALAAANDPNKASKGMGIRFVSWTKTTNNLRNLTVNNCTFEDCYEGVYTNPVYGVSVTNSRFNNINHNAVAIQDVDSAVNHGDVVISGNTFTNVSDRIIRFNNVGDGTTITITGNTSVNSGDSAGEIIKATTMPDSVNVNMTSNTWGDVNGKTAVLGNGFKPTSTAVATVGGVEYTTLAEAIAALNSTNHTLTLIDASAWDAATPVYWQAGTQSGYAAKLTDALTAAYKANAGDITIVCRPGADVGAMTHGHVADNLTVYGNNAYISGGECDLEVDTYMYSRETGKQVATGGVYLDKDITITAYELDNLGVWGQRHTGFTINISLNDCDGKAIEGKANVQRVYISVRTGVNNITVVGCDFLTKATALYSNADGETIIDNCSFAGSQVPVNFNHKANGTQTVTVKNSTFTNCGDNGDWKQFAAPVRFVNSGSGTLTAAVDNCTFAGTVGANGDILLGDGRNGEASFNVSVTVVDTAANVQIHQPGYYGADGSTTVANCEKTTVAKSDTPTTFFTVAVAEVTFTDGTTKKYSDIAEAIAAAKNGDTVTLLADINTPEKTYEITKSLTIDLNGKTVTGSGYDGVFEVTGKNIEVFLNATNGGKVIAVENSGSAGKYAMAVWMCGAGSTLTINGGEFIQNITSKDDKQMDMIYASAGKIIINSGSFTSGTPKWTLNINDSAYKAGTANIIVNGGTFTDYDPRNAENEGKGTSLVANGVGIDKNADGTFTAKSGMAAQIVDADGNSVAAYATLADAIAAAKDGDTVKLLANLTETDAANAHIVYDLAGKTLDLNGFTYSHNNFAHVFEGTGGVIKNGKMVCDNGSYALFIGDEGETTSFTVDGVEMVGGINIYNASGVVLKNLTVNGTNYYAVWMDEGASATIESGTYNAGDVAVLGSGDKSELHVTGGTFCANEQKLVSANKNGVVAISGGSFTKEVLPEYCADRYIPTQNEDGTYGVKEATKGSVKNPYTLEELGKMTRDQYIAAQEALGGTMYVEIGNYSYGTNGVLGNGVRNDTPGQTEDRSVLNGYNSNGYLGKNNDGANGKDIIFVGGSITSGVTGYASIDNIGTSLLLAVPAYTNVTFEGTTFNNVMSFDYQLYTSPWSQLGELKFDNCEFNGLIVGAIAAQKLTFNGCEFKNYTNTTKENNSNPTWIRPAYGNWTQGDNEGQGSDFSSLTTINFTGNKVTSTRPVKFERIAQWEMETKVTVTGNKFDIKSDGSSKNVGLYFGANAKFDLVVDNNEKTDGTAALYTAVYKAPNGTDYEGLPAGSTVKNSNGADVEVAGVIWKSTDALTLKTTTEAVELVNSKGISVKFATLEEAFAAAKNGDTITLLSDVELSSTIVIKDVMNVTLDLNGKKLSTTTKTGDATRHYYAIDNYGTFTLRDSSAEQSGEIRARGIENLGTGTMTIESGKIVAIDANGGAAIWNNANLTINGGTFVAEHVGASSDQYGPGCVYNNGTLTINGGTFTSANKRTYAIVSKAGTVTITPADGKNVTISGAHGGLGIDGGTAIINGGSYASSDYYGLYVSNDAGTADVTVNGGTFTGKKYSVLIGSDGSSSVTSTLKIKGGTFDMPIHAQENTIDGAIAISGGKFKFKVDDKYFDGDHACSTDTTDGYYTVAGHPITGMGLTLSKDISIRIVVDAKYKDGKIKATYETYDSTTKGMVTKELILDKYEYEWDDDGKPKYQFRISNITPQMADVVFTIQYMDGDNEIGSAKQISIVEYCRKFAETDKFEAYKAKIGQLLNYCATAMDFRAVSHKDDMYNGLSWAKRATALRAKISEFGYTVADFDFGEIAKKYINQRVESIVTGYGVEFAEEIKLYFFVDIKNYKEGYTYGYGDNAGYLIPVPDYEVDKQTGEKILIGYRFYFSIDMESYCERKEVAVYDANGVRVQRIGISLEWALKKLYNNETNSQELRQLCKAAYQYFIIFAE